LDSSYTHPNAACYQNVRACEHVYADPDHAGSNGAAFCDADRCPGDGHRHGDERAADGDSNTLGHADRDECAADGDTYTLGYADGDECTADGDLYTVGHTHSDERTADGHRD